MKSIFVTGAAGFIGANLVKRLFKDQKGAAIVELPPLRTPRLWNATSASPRRQRCGKACGSLRNGMLITICHTYSKVFSLRSSFRSHRLHGLHRFLFASLI